MSTPAETLSPKLEPDTTHSGVLNLVAIAVTSAIPIAGILFFGWNTFEVALLVWLDGAVKCLFTILKILTRPPGDIPRFKVAAFCTVNFGGFFAGHLLAMIILLSGATSGESAESLMLGIFNSIGWRLTLVAILLSYFSAYWTGFRAPGADRAALSNLSILETRARIWIVQIGVVIMAYIVNELDAPALHGLLGLILMKVLSDMFFEWREGQIRQKA